MRKNSFFILILFILCLAILILDKCNVQVGVASRYSNSFKGKKTSSGERYDPAKLTAAHPSLPLGARVKVTNLENAKEVIVKINDRGPYFEGRIVDLSLAAARQLGMIRKGIAKVKIERIN